MEVKIGVRNVARELVIDTDATPEDVLAAVTAAKESGAFQLQDAKGKTVIVPADALGYVEIGESAKGRVGFGA
ncbi:MULTISPECIES: DUF3107 domain-containing protein [unclassified Janibacter]|uniref:DUF3107 domain-containing protein n=1 Tax=unclassified Janibacter TaxID=2649294 RepID=UPI003CFE3506